MNHISQDDGIRRPVICNRLRFLLLRDLAVTGLLELPMMIHDVFHLTDWFQWGLGWYGADWLRVILYPVFEHDMLGYVAHATVLLLAWAGLAFLAVRTHHYVRLLERALSRLLR